MKPLFLLDVDGVICDIISAICAYVNKYYESQEEPRRIYSGNFTEYRFEDCPELTTHDVNIIGQYLAHTSHIEMRPYPGADKFVDNLLQMGDVAVVTTPWPPNKRWAEWRKLWLITHFRELAEKTIFTCDKSAVAGDILIEDCVGNASVWTRANPNGTALLLERPWNVGAKKAPPWATFFSPSYDDLLRKVELLSRSGRE